MKIENLIDDIAIELTDIKNQIEDQVFQKYPSLNFQVTLPDLYELNPVKIIQLFISKDGQDLVYEVEIHTHNLFKIFEIFKLAQNSHHANSDETIINEWFKEQLRCIIRKNKTRRKSGLIF